MESQQPPSQPQPAAKLRFMCSYGGHIIQRPRVKSLSYLGGETRIVVVNPTTSGTLAAFISHLSTALSLKFPFTVKYQLPRLGLDSLISLSSDDDLQFLFCEHIRLSSSSSPSRIRLFIFCSAPETATTTHNVIHHPKTEAWFVDALKSAKILQKGRDCFGGYDVEGLSTGENGESKSVRDLAVGAVSLAESMVLETSSSFGSSSSSASLTNLPPVNEDVGFNSPDSAAKLTTPESVAAIASEKTETCQLPIQPPSAETGAVSFPAISESNFHDPAAGIHAHQMLDYYCGYLQASPLTPFHAATAPVENRLPGMFPVSSYYQVQQPLPQQQHQFLHYQPNHMYPLYYLPVQTQVSTSYTLPMWGLSEPPNASHLLPQTAHMEATSEPTPQNFATTSEELPTFPKISDEILQQQQPVSQCADAASGEIASNRNDFSDDPARIQIYKSQPPPPAIPSQLQSKTKASTTLLSDALARLQMIKIQQ